MQNNKITREEIDARKVQNLPTRPTAPQEFGGRGYTATELKAYFDALPELVAERLNRVIDTITREDSTGVRKDIKTGISPSHTLLDFFVDIKTGIASQYITVLDQSLVECITNLNEKINEIYTILERNSLK